MLMCTLRQIGVAPMGRTGAGAYISRGRMIRWGRRCRNRVYFIFEIDAICCENSYLKARPSLVAMVDGDVVQLYFSVFSELANRFKSFNCGCRGGRKNSLTFEVPLGGVTSNLGKSEVAP